jgi:hypothetical protein
VSGVCPDCDTSWELHDGPCGQNGEITNTHRLAVIQEIWKHARETSQSDGFRALYAYEDSVKARETSR